MISAGQAALRALRALVDNAGFAGTFASPGRFRSALLGESTPSKDSAHREVRALISSDGYAATFQSMDGYRAALLQAIDQRLIPIP